MDYLNNQVMNNQVMNNQVMNDQVMNDQVRHDSCRHNSPRQCCARKYCLVNNLEENRASDLCSEIRHTKVLNKENSLFMRGDNFRWIYLIRSGSFKCSIAGDNGDYQITSFYFAGDVLGMDGIETGHHLYDVEALETSSVCTLPYHYIEKHNQGELFRYLIRIVSAQAYKESRLLFVLGRMHAEQRLASFLVEMSLGRQLRHQSTVELNLSMTRQDIASYLGVAVETVSRLFSRFEIARLITVNRRQIRINDMEGLQHILDGEYRFSMLGNVA